MPMLSGGPARPGMWWPGRSIAGPWIMAGGPCIMLAMDIGIPIGNLANIGLGG